MFLSNPGMIVDFTKITEDDMKIWYEAGISPSALLIWWNDHLKEDRIRKEKENSC